MRTDGSCSECSSSRRARARTSSRAACATRSTRVRAVPSARAPTSRQRPRLARRADARGNPRCSAWAFRFRTTKPRPNTARARSAASGAARACARRTWRRARTCREARPRLIPRTEEARPRLTPRTEEARPRLIPRTEEARPRLTPRTEEARPRLTPRTREARPASPTHDPTQFARTGSGPAQELRVAVLRATRAVAAVRVRLAGLTHRHALRRRVVHGFVCVVRFVGRGLGRGLVGRPRRRRRRGGRGGTAREREQGEREGSEDAHGPRYAFETTEHQGVADFTTMPSKAAPRTMPP